MSISLPPRNGHALGAAAGAIVATLGVAGALLRAGAPICGGIGSVLGQGSC